MKNCYKCKKNKKNTEFGKNKSKYDGLATECKICKSSVDKIYRSNNANKIKAAEKNYYKNNKKIIAEKQLLYRKKNKEIINDKARAEYTKNRELILATNKAWRDANKKYVIAYNQSYQRQNKNKLAKYKKEWERKQKNNIQYRLKKNLRERVRAAARGIIKTGSAVSDLGCSTKELRSYLENKFYPNTISGEKMTWDNYGVYGWHIDHVIPISSFDLASREQFLKACHYTNLQPLWAKDNLKKGAKILFNNGAK